MGCHIWRWYTCAAEALKMGVFGSAPSLKMGGGGALTKQTQEILEKMGWSFAQAEKKGSLRAAQAENGGHSGGTHTFCPN